jgi:hypothetical protein
VVLLWLGLLEWLPFNPGGGYHFTCALVHWISGRRMPERLQMMLVMLLFPVVIILGIRMYWIDLRWLWQAFVA